MKTKKQFKNCQYQNIIIFDEMDEIPLTKNEIRESSMEETMLKINTYQEKLDILEEINYVKYQIKIWENRKQRALEALEVFKERELNNE